MESLTGVVKHYAWGSHDAIPNLLCQPEDGAPWAEYWLGTHIAGPAVLADGSTLDGWLSTHQEAVNQAELASFGLHLPYLLKLLSADQPLSLQAHPSRADAEAGFAAEESRGLAIDDPNRNFKDKWPKPELLVAITPFEALSGFREPSKTLELFDALGVDEDVMRPTLGPLRYRDGAAALAEVFLDCLTLDDTRHAILNHVLSAAVRHTEDEGEAGRFARLAIMLDEYHPGDPSLLAALLLNHVDLAPGQAMHNHPGVIHSYLHGTGVEVMASSDNVLRAGLTSKHVDHAALAGIVDFRPADPDIVDPVSDGTGFWHYRTKEQEFSLWRLEPTPEVGETPLPARGQARLVLLIDGHVTMHATDEDMELVQGEAAFIGADETATIAGDAMAFLAAPGI